MLTGLAGPQAALITATLTYAKDSTQEAGDNIRTYWTQSEIEEAYQLYIKSGSALEGDFETIFSLKGNAEALMNERIIKAHCAKYGMGRRRSDAPARQTCLRTRGWAAQLFKQRKAAKRNREVRQAEEAYLER
jgi:hypothetical protein